MSLHAQLQQRAAEGKPIRIGLIGAGKFGSMYLAQIPRTPGVHLVGIADLSPDARARQPRARRLEAERSAGRVASTRRCKTGATHIGDDWQALVRHPAIDVIVECTGHPIAAVDHCLEAFAHGKHVVNVTVEADAFCGPLLARKAAEAGVDLFARLRRPAGADLRPGRLGAHLRLPGGRPPAAATSGCRTSANRRPRRCGATTA